MVITKKVVREGVGPGISMVRARSPRAVLEHLGCTAACSSCPCRPREAAGARQTGSPLHTRDADWVLGSWLHMSYSPWGVRQWTRTSPSLKKKKYHKNVEKLQSCYVISGNVMVHAIWKIVWQFVINLLYDSASPNLQIYPKESKTYLLKDSYNMFNAASLIKSYNVETL